jgi:hypothetical protein
MIMMMMDESDGEPAARVGRLQRSSAKLTRAESGHARRRASFVVRPARPPAACGAGRRRARPLGRLLYARSGRRLFVDAARWRAFHQNRPAVSRSLVASRWRGMGVGAPQRAPDMTRSARMLRARAGSLAATFRAASPSPFELTLLGVRLGAD